MADSAAKTLEDQQQPVEEDKPHENEGGKSEQEEEEEEEAGECGFCVYMKGGGCKESFTAWELCIEEAEKNKQDIAEKCFDITSSLKKCMEAHSDYYEPILRAEKAAEAEAVQELEKEKAAAADKEQNAAPLQNSEQQHSESASSK